MFVFFGPPKREKKPKTCWFRNSILIRPKRHRQSNAMATLIAGGLFATRVPAGSDWDVLGISGAKFVKTKTSASRKEKQPQGGKTHLSRNTFRGLVHSYKEHKSFFFGGEMVIIQGVSLETKKANNPKNSKKFVNVICLAIGSTPQIRIIEGIWRRGGVSSHPET